MNRFLCAASALTIFAVSTPVSAHLGLEDPPSRYGRTVLKSGPCGMGDGERSDNVTTFAPGETITVQWDEYVNHPGHFRISFDEDGQDDFVDPPCLSECDNGNMEIETYSNDAVLLDAIEDKDGGIYQVDVTLPNVQCDNCTLQVIQVMTDKPPYTLGGNDLYYQCADLVLEGDLAPDMGGGADMGAADMGSDAGTLDMGTTGEDTGITENNNPNNTTADTGTGGTDDTGTGGDDAGTDGGGQMEDDGGCCRVVASHESNAGWATGLLLLAFAWIRRRG